MIDSVPSIKWLFSCTQHEAQGMAEAVMKSIGKTIILIVHNFLPFLSYLVPSEFLVEPVYEARWVEGNGHTPWSSHVTLIHLLLILFTHCMCTIMMTAVEKQ